MTLRTVLTWYPQLDLSLLGAVHAGSANMLNTAYLAINQRCAEIASWLNPQEYVPFLDKEGMPVPHMKLSELACNTEETSPANSLSNAGIESSSREYQDDDLKVESSGSSS